MREYYILTNVKNPTPKNFRKHVVYQNNNRDFIHHALLSLPKCVNKYDVWVVCETEATISFTPYFDCFAKVR